MIGGTVQATMFVHPGLAVAALVGGLIPVIIHLIVRRHYRRVPWAAMAFLMAAGRRSARRLRFENWLLLFLRVCIVLLVGLAIARPLLDRDGSSVLAAPRCHRILVIDDSLSMQATGQADRSRFATAMAHAERLVDSFPKGDDISIVTLGSPAAARIEEGVRDRRQVHELLRTLARTEQKADVPGALTQVGEIVGASQATPGNHFVYIISDFARGSWQRATQEGSDLARGLARLSEKLGTDPRFVQAVPVGRDVQGNVAITGFVADAPVVCVGRPVRLRATVENFGTMPVAGGTIQFRRGGQIIHQTSLPALPAGRTTTIEAATLFAEPGNYGLEVRVSGVEPDALAVDDRRFLSLNIAAARPILLVDGTPGQHPLAGGAGYLATALAPQHGPVRTPADVGSHAGSDDVFLPRLIGAADLAGEVLGDYATIALCNVEQLPADIWQRLSTYVDQGGALAIMFGDRVSADHYNSLKARDGTPLLPGDLGEPWPPPDKPDATTRFALPQPPHALLADFADRSASGLFTALTRRYRAFAVDRARGEVVLAYETGDPALIVSPAGEGMLALWTTSADMSWCNLPSRGDFVSTMVSLFGHLSTPQRRDGNVVVGDTLTLPLSVVEAAQPVVATHSRGEDVPGRHVPHGEGLAYAYGPTTKSGLVMLTFGATKRCAAINTAAAESDINGLSIDALTAALAGVGTVADMEAWEDPSAATASTGELASLSLWAALVLLIVETGASKRFGEAR